MSKKDLTTTVDRDDEVSEEVTSDVSKEMPEYGRISVLPLRDVVVYPHMVIPLFVGREKSIVALDRAMDTPTLLGITHTAPYFHDGSQPTLRAVNEWFNETYAIGLSESELSDLTAYVETVGDGVEPYEDTIYYLDAEMEEFSFFLSAFDFLEAKNKPELINTTFQTIALEIRNHKWELQDYAVMPVMERLAEIMDEAYEANLSGQRGLVHEKLHEYRELYAFHGHRLN